MKNHEDNRRPEEIEQDIEQTRAQLSSNIDAIQSKLTPGQMMDQAIHYARNSLPADFGSSLNTAIRENPIPVTLIGLGVGWLMMSGKQRPGYMMKRTGYLGDSHRPGSGFADEHGLEFGGQGELNDHGVGGHVTGDHDSAVRRASLHVSDKGHDLKSRASETSHNLREKAGTATQGVKEKMSMTGQSIKETASSLSSRFSDSASSVSEQSRSMAQNARMRANDFSQRSQQQYQRSRDTLAHMAEEQPLMLGALGLAVGVLFGAMAPATRREDELMGKTRDQFFERGKEMARQQAESVKSSAQRVAETAKEEAQRLASESGQQPNGHAYSNESLSGMDEAGRGTPLH